MKKLTLLLLISFFSVQSFSQALQRRKCKGKSVVVLDYNEKVKENQVVAGLGNLKPELMGQSIAELTPKDYRKIRKQAGWFKSCIVYVDFDHKWLDYDENGEPNYSEDWLTLIIVLERKVKT